MYFDIQPKTEKEDLFGVDAGLQTFISHLQNPSTRMIVIKGLRRTGKTSLLNVALKESKVDYVKIDVREGPFYSRDEFMAFLIKKIRQKIGESYIDKVMKKISGVALSYKEFTAQVFFSKKENLSFFFETLSKELGKRQLILAFDEAQLLKEIHFDFILASIFDNYKNIKLVLTGSEVGLLDNFLGKKEYQAPLYGRAYFEIESRRLNEEDAIRFLQEGSYQIHKTILFHELQDVRENLDGIIGWLTQYGYLRLNVSHEKALERIKEEGKEIVRKEFAAFLQTRKAKQRYMNIVKEIAKGNNIWTILKHNLAKAGTKVGDSQLVFYLKELIDYGYIEKTNERYSLADPLLVLVAREYI